MFAEEPRRVVGRQGKSQRLKYISQTVDRPSA